MSHEETKRPKNTFDFTGKWLPSADPLMIGAKNFAAVENMVPSPNGMEGTLGYSRVMTEPVSDTHPIVRSGIQLRQIIGAPSRLIVQAQNATQTESVLLEQVASGPAEDIPAAPIFLPTPMHTDAEGAGLGRFSRWPNHSIAYCNGRETLIYAGDEVYPAGFIVGGSPIGDTIENAIDYTAAVRNTLKTPGNIATIAGAVDPFTVLYLDFEDGDTVNDFVDKAPVPHIITPSGTISRSTTYPKFGAYAGKIGSSGKLSASASAAFSFGTAPFTIDYQGRLGYGTHGIAGQYMNNQNYWYVVQTNGYADIGAGVPLAASTVTFKAVVDGTTVAHYTWAFYDKWYKNYWNKQYAHIEICRSGETMYCWRRGLQASSGFTTVVHKAVGNGALPDLSDTPLDLFRVHNGSYQASGYFDEVRISKGSARHITPFTPPTTSYAREHRLFAVLTNRPIESVKCYIANTNKVPGATLSGVCWTGSEYETLDITDGTAGLSVDKGVISFASTVGSAQKKLINGHYRYLYAFELSDGSADLYQVTTSPPLQPICDIWDGMFRPVLEFRQYRNGKYIDDTAKVLESTPAGVTPDEAYVATLGELLQPSTDYFDIATAERSCAFKITMCEQVEDRVNVKEALMAPHYWNGDAYTAPRNIVDMTLDEETSTKTLRRSGLLSYTPPPPGQEFQKEERGMAAWRYRVTISDVLNNKDLNRKVWIDKVEAVPASQLPPNLGYKFPFMMGNRAMLCNLVTTGEGNRVDFPLSGSTEGWNGEDSSFGEGKQPIYIGGSEELIAACEIFNRLGSSVYSFALFMKAKEVYLLQGYDAETYEWKQVTDKVGCPAPLTLDTCQMPNSQDRESSRTVAAWLSHAGPYMFDTGAIVPISGLECYFDPLDPRCVNFAAIDKAVGWFDPDKPRYNLQFPSGPGQAENNVWVFFDFESQRWFLKKPSCESPYLTAVIPVADASHRRYIFGLRDNGQMMRLDYGTTWDGSGIAQMVETGEIYPSGDLWDICRYVFLKLIFIPIAETATLTVTLYQNGHTDPAGIVIAEISLFGTGRYVRYHKPMGMIDFASCRLRFSATTSATPRGMQLLAWSAKLKVERKDDQ